MLVNLLQNALEAAGSNAVDASDSRSSPRVRIEVACDDQRHVVCRVGDTGPGPAAELAALVFEPFVTDKPDGTGLGLSVVRQIAEEHGAELSWRRVGEMTEFSVLFSVLK